MSRLRYNKLTKFLGVTHQRRRPVASFAGGSQSGNLNCPDGYTLVCDRSSRDEVTCSCVKYGSEGEIVNTTIPTGGTPTPED